MRVAERTEQFLSGRQWAFVAAAITIFVFYYYLDPRSALTLTKLAGVFLVSLLWSEPMISFWIALLGCTRATAIAIATVISSGALITTMFSISGYSRERLFAKSPRWLRPILRFLLPKIPMERVGFVSCAIVYFVVFCIAMSPTGTWISLFIVQVSSLRRRFGFLLILVANALKNFGWGRYLRDTEPQLYLCFALGSIMFALYCVDVGRERKSMRSEPHTFP